MGRITPATITYLEMKEEPLITNHPPGNVGQLALIHAVRMPVPYYRYLFDQVGRAYMWFSRTLLDDTALTDIIHDDRVEIFVLYRDGSPAGYFELDFRQGHDVELLFLGLTPENIGLGLGRFLLNAALQRAWDGQDGGPKTERVHLQTCTLDHPSALRAYQRAGFTPFSQETVDLDIPEAFFQG